MAVTLLKISLILFISGIFGTEEKVAADEWFLSPDETHALSFQLYPNDQIFFSAHQFLGHKVQIKQQLMQPISNYQTYYMRMISELSEQHSQQIDQLVQMHRPNLALLKQDLAYHDLIRLQQDIEVKDRISPKLKQLLTQAREQYHALGLQLQILTLDESYIQKQISNINNILHTLRHLTDSPNFYHEENFRAFIQVMPILRPLLNHTCQEVILAKFHPEIPFPDLVSYPNSGWPLGNCTVKISIPSHPLQRMQLENQLSRVWRHLNALLDHFLVVLNHQSFDKTTNLSQLAKSEDSLSFGDYAKYSYHEFLISTYLHYQKNMNSLDQLEAAIAAGSLTAYYRQHPLLENVHKLHSLARVLPAYEYYSNDENLKLKLCKDIAWHSNRMLELDAQLSELQQSLAAIMKQYKLDGNSALLRRATELMTQMQELVKLKNELGYLDYISDDRRIELQWELSEILPSLLPNAKNIPWQIYDAEVVYVQMGDSFWSAGMPFNITDLLPRIIELRLEEVPLTGNEAITVNQFSHLRVRFMESPYTACAGQQVFQIVIQLRSAQGSYHLVMSR